MMDPKKILWHRLFLFWEAYDLEFTLLLDKWHRDATRLRGDPPRPSFNPLWDSFLDTWGKGGFVDDRVKLDDKSYFAALGAVSVGVKADCLRILQSILKTDSNKNIIFPPELAVDDETANREADNELKRLLKDEFSKEFDALEKKVDPCVKKAADESRGDEYLLALHRMTTIETGCFEVQKHFLETGEVIEPTKRSTRVG
jgi:hypothetical protein